MQVAVAKVQTATAVAPVSEGEAPDAEGQKALTPMMKQYLETKAQVPDALLFFRLGDFYEMFFDDAVKAAELLHITLTSRAKGARQGADVRGAVPLGPALHRPADRARAEGGHLRAGGRSGRAGHRASARWCGW